MAGPRDTPNVPTMKPDGTHQETVVLNDFGGVEFSQRTRTSASGNTAVRYTLDIDAEPILHNLRGLDLGAKPAQAILALIQRQHRNVSEFAKPATIAFREKMARAFAGQSGKSGMARQRRGEFVVPARTDKAYAQARYSGGKMGPMPPAQTKRLGLDSGRLQQGWFVRANPAEGNYTINAPANRLDPATFGGGLGALQAWIARLVQVVPALTGRGVLDDDGFVKAVADSPVVAVLKGDYARKVAGIYGRAIWGGAKRFAAFL